MRMQALLPISGYVLGANRGYLTHPVCSLRIGLFTIPTQIVFVVAPTNVLLNYLLGSFLPPSTLPLLTPQPVWGPEPIRLGFIGAPIATAISFNLISLFSIIYGVFFVPHTAWCPISRRSFTSLGVLLQLGLSGVGQTASEWWAWELVALAASLYVPEHYYYLTSTNTAIAWAQWHLPHNLSYLSRVQQRSKHLLL